MELYCSARPETCLGCSGPIIAGDVVVPAERGWLLCLDCGAGLLLGQSLPAWPGADPAPEATEAPTSIASPDASLDAAPGTTGDVDRWEAMLTHPVSMVGQARPASRGR